MSDQEEQQNNSSIDVGTQTPKESNRKAIARSANLMSVCVMISRITGFARTWAMAFALGATFLSSSYQVANNLPNQLYELVMGGMLVTAFLPVYVSVKRKLGKEAGNEYASNLLTLVIIILGVVSLLGILFPQAIVYTQSFYTDQSEMTVAIMLFQFFAIQTVFYGASSIISGLLNANREYFWSSIAPVFNNLVVIATFILYAVIAPLNSQVALYIIAIGNPLGVFLQMAIQLPALKRNSIRLRLRINLKDPALKDTFKIGAPTILIVVFSFITVSVMNAASYCFADNGPSVIAYARLWYTLPYSFLAIPLTTALFTELSELRADNNIKGVVQTIEDGTSQILFILSPFMLYLIVFAQPLVTLYHTGAFTTENIQQIALFLSALALALPFYGMSAYMQKVFSSLRKMGFFAIANTIASVIQVVLTMAAAAAAQSGLPISLESIAIASAIYYIVVDLIAALYLKHLFSDLSLAHLGKSLAMGLMLGGLGAVVGGLIMFGLTIIFSPLDGSIPQALIYIVIGGLSSLAATFGLALKFKMPEAAMARSFVEAFSQKIMRRH